MDPFALRGQLWSRPPINIPVHHLTFRHPSSLVLGLMLYSRSNPFLIPPKAPSSIGLSPQFPIEAIASLTESKLYYNSLYHKLQENHDYLSKVLAKYLGRDLAGPHVTPTTTFILDICQGA
jgi:hypothetical protein